MASMNCILWLYTIPIILFQIIFVSNQNVTTTLPPRRLGRDSNVMAMLQQIMQRLGIIEAESQQQTTQLRDTARALTRLEVQKQDLVSLMDRIESRLTQRLDDVRGDIRKMITLQEVLREDVDKLQQNQLVNKVWFEEQLRQLKIQFTDDKKEIIPETTIAPFANSDVLANLQIVQTTLYGIRRMVDTIQNGVAVLRANVTDLTNFTRLIYNQTESMPTKQYILSVIRSTLSEQQSPQITCVMPLPPDPSRKKFRDCQEILDEGYNKSGIYRIQPEFSIRPFFVYCDMEVEGGGWTIFQRRKDGSVDFLRNWIDYKHGFGNIEGEYWLGNDNLHLLTNQDLYEIRIDLYDFDDGKAYAKYSAFAIGSEKENYMLKILGQFTSGDAGDGMSYHVSMEFSTLDADNDKWVGGSCAKDHKGGWWYNQCDASNLNGQYLGGLTQQEYQGVYWYEWQGPSYSLRATEMKIKPVKR